MVVHEQSHLYLFIQLLRAGIWDMTARCRKRTLLQASQGQLQIRFGLPVGTSVPPEREFNFNRLEGSSTLPRYFHSLRTQRASDLVRISPQGRVTLAVGLLANPRPSSNPVPFLVHVEVIALC